MNMTWFFDLLSTALYTVFIQNLVFNGGYAASEALMLAKKPRRLWMFSAMMMPKVRDASRSIVW